MSQPSYMPQLVHGFGGTPLVEALYINCVVPIETLVQPASQKPHKPWTPVDFSARVPPKPCLPSTYYAGALAAESGSRAHLAIENTAQLFAVEASPKTKLRPVANRSSSVTPSWSVPGACGGPSEAARTFVRLLASHCSLMAEYPEDGSGRGSSQMVTGTPKTSCNGCCRGSRT